MAQLVLPLGTRAALGREDFIVAASNREAVAFIDSYPDWPAPAVALYGPSGSGKSHLAAAWAARAQARIVAAAKLDDEVLQNEAPIAIEDVDAAAPDAMRDRVLFGLIERRVPMLLTGANPPSLWPSILSDLASRFRALLAFGLWAPDDALLDMLVSKLLADRQLSVPDNVIAHMIKALERSPAAIRDFVDRADAKALSEKRPISLSLIREILATRA